MSELLDGLIAHARNGLNTPAQQVKLTTSFSENHDVAELSAEAYGEDTTEGNLLKAWAELEHKAKRTFLYNRPHVTITNVDMTLTPDKPSKLPWEDTP